MWIRVKEPWWFVDNWFEDWCDEHPRYMKFDAILREHFELVMFLVILAALAIGLGFGGWVT
jgi:hypothetical protein